MAREVRIGTVVDYGHGYFRIDKIDGDRFHMEGASVGIWGSISGLKSLVDKKEWKIMPTVEMDFNKWLLKKE